MPMGLGLLCSCCGAGCGVCSGGAAPSFQATLSGISQTNAPGSDPTPPCGCTSYNTTAAMLLFIGDIGSFLGSPNPITDANETPDYCIYTADFDCPSSGANGVTAYIVFYKNDTGGSAIFVRVEIAESSSVFFSGNVATHEGLEVLDSGSPTVDCSELDVSVPTSFIGNAGSFGGTVWCGGTPVLRIEAV